MKSTLEMEKDASDPCAPGIFLKYYYIKLVVHFQDSEFLLTAKESNRLKLQHMNVSSDQILLERTENTTGTVLFLCKDRNTKRT